MKVKVRELRNMSAGINEKITEKLPAKTAYRLFRFLNKLTSEINAFEKARVNLAIRYAKKDKNGKPLMEKDKDGKDINKYDILDKIAFEKEYMELTNEEIEIDWEPIKLADLGDVKLSILDLIKLGKIIKEAESKK